MPDDESKTDNRDLLRVAGGEDYEVRYLVKETGIEQVLVKRHQRPQDAASFVRGTWFETRGRRHEGSLHPPVS